MTKFASIQISADRLTLWRRRNERNETVTTPMILISAIHNAAPADPLVCLNITEDIALIDLRNMLTVALRDVEAMIAKGN